MVYYVLTKNGRNLSPNPPPVWKTWVRPCTLKDRNKILETVPALRSKYDLQINYEFIKMMGAHEVLISRVVRLNKRNFKRQSVNPNRIINGVDKKDLYKIDLESHSITAGTW